MVSRRQWYERVNAAWPAEVPELTAPEAVRAVRRLYRFVRKRKLELPIKITSGNRYTGRGRGGVVLVNPAPGDPRQGYKRHGGGWQALVHDLSHWLGGGHSKDHARLERRMIREVVRRGWLSGVLKIAQKPAPAPVDVQAERHRSILARIDRWLAKKKRANRALMKLARQRRYYERLAA